MNYEESRTWKNSCLSTSISGPTVLQYFEVLPPTSKYSYQSSGKENCELIAEVLPESRMLQLHIYICVSVFFLCFT